MKQDTWEKLEKMFVDAPEMRAESVSYQEIDKVARENGFKLPEDYRIHSSLRGSYCWPL